MKADSIFFNRKKRRESFGLPDTEPISPLRKRKKMKKICKKEVKLKGNFVGVQVDLPERAWLMWVYRNDKDGKAAEAFFINLDT